MSKTTRALRVLTLSAYADSEPITSFRRLVEQDRFGLHTQCESAADADIMLFVESSHYHDDPLFSILRNHEFLRKHREKVFMYNEHDRPWCIVPGIYTSLDRRYSNPARQRSTAYVQQINPFVSYSNHAPTPDILFSFTGRASTSKIRARILELKHSRASISDSAKTFNAYSPKDKETSKDDQQRFYARELARSKFVLCPRGVGTSSYRLFETLKAGRVPVVVSDHYVYPVGPDWSRFSIRVPERDIEAIPDILEEREAEWVEMAASARQAWIDWFAPDVLFHHMVESCAEILDSRKRPERIAQLLPQRAFLEWRARAIARPIRDRLRLVVGR